ncbi:hypothetical protein AX769_22410 (plasmid) [Frondihabitans sp. PAMC 28766]|uniref:hypothetical protein n=1 Tax=Frondihabitans sp. PAMC 28766 TaxID=1795630 RepID=UPI00078DB6EF|nr:hypothetical protein [Frondihabitans sp. PAMC 28766]AMM22881.1 hypothetical protein AX769_22410 [Frondihabitans sp. PAMC 28766]
MTSPFDDPEFVAALAGMGVTHVPGMAAAMMEDIAPLLAAEGIDLNGLGEDVSLDDVNEALARATERHNLTLFTPVGAQRDGALALLRRFAVSLADGDGAAAAAVLDGVESEPGEGEPGVSHVIGVSLGVLDSWHTDPGLRAAVAATRVPRWNRAARAVATDVLSLARKGRAVASLASLHRHGGLALFEGSALLVAATLIARAEYEKNSVSEVAALMLGDGGTRRPSASPGLQGASDRNAGSSFTRSRPAPGATRRRRESSAHPAGASGALTGRALWRGFAAWLEHAPSYAAPTVAEELRVLQAVAKVASGQGVDLHRPVDMEALIDLLWDADDPENPGALQAVLETVDDYVHYRLDTGHDVAGWENAHEAVQDALDDVNAGLGPLDAILEDAEQVNDTVRRDALARTPLVGAVNDVLDWIGTGRPVTQTGGVRRADIEHVAGLLGIRAVGVAKRIGREDDDDLVQALSMTEVPVLPQWWEALLAAGVIRTTSSRVWPGPTASTWAAGELPPLEAAEAVAAIFVAETLTRPLRDGGFGEWMLQGSVLSLVAALAPDDFDVPESPIPGGDLWTVHHLERAGLVSVSDTGRVRIADGHRAAITRGLIALTLLTDSDTDTDTD